MTGAVPLLLNPLNNPCIFFLDSNFLNLLIAPKPLTSLLNLKGCKKKLQGLKYSLNVEISCIISSIQTIPYSPNLSSTMLLSLRITSLLY